MASVVYRFAAGTSSFETRVFSADSLSVRYTRRQFNGRRQT